MYRHRTTRPARRGALHVMVGVLGAVALLAGCESSDAATDQMDQMDQMQDGAMDEMDAMESGRMDDGMEQMQVTYADWRPRFTANGELRLPPENIWRLWPQVGTPLTPNALNNGEAPFPEFHQVYIDPVSWRHWRDTGEFREGTVLAKELVEVYESEATPAMADGSTQQVSGRGYFMGDFIGFEIAYKSAEHYPDAPGNWAYFTFGHHPEPYAPSTPPQPLDQCSSCHQASAADDFVFTQFYPVLRWAKADR